MKKVTDRIIELGDRKEQVTQEDLPYIISDVLKHDTAENKVKLLSYFVTLAKGLKPMATLSIEINGKVYQESSSGDREFRTRGFDADQTEAAIKATMKMLNMIEDEYSNSN